MHRRSPSRRIPPAACRALGAVVAVVVLGVTGCGPRTTPGAHSPAPASGTAVPWAHGMRVVPASALPAEAQRTLRLIASHGPFPYSKDGEVFGNYEGALPREPRGYYHAYTVPSPGSAGRGARRIVTGSGDEAYYTQDHYRTFVAVVRGR